MKKAILVALSLATALFAVATVSQTDATALLRQTLGGETQNPTSESFTLDWGADQAASAASTVSADASEPTTAPSRSATPTDATPSASARTGRDGGFSDSTPVQTLRDFNNAIVDIASRTNPTVVTITTAQTVRYRQVDPFSMFFGEFYGRERSQVRRGLGSGVILSEDGIIVTNHHVIEGAEQILVRLFEGEELEAEVLGSDPMMDIAVLKLDRTGLPSLRTGDSDGLQVGELVLAVGSPLDESLAHSVSMGIVSAKGRSIGIYDNVQGYENFIQTDAAINPGNSGGALVNMDGELVGINSAIASRSGGNQGIGFAIPVNMVRQAVESIVEKGRVVRGFLGITWGGDVDQAMAKALRLDQPFGVIVGNVSEDGPAEKAGIRAEDVLIRLNGEPIRSWANFRTRIASTAPGEVVRIELVRDGRERTVTVELGELDAQEPVSEAGPNREELIRNFGVDVQALDANLRDQLNLEESVDGVVVTRVENESAAYRQGLRRGDVITQIQGESVRNANEFFRTLQQLAESGEEAVLFRVNRQGQRLFIAIELS